MTILPLLTCIALVFYLNNNNLPCINTNFFPQCIYILFCNNRLLCFKKKRDNIGSSTVWVYRSLFVVAKRTYFYKDNLSFILVIYTAQEFQEFFFYFFFYWNSTKIFSCTRTLKVWRQKWEQYVLKLGENEGLKTRFYGEFDLAKVLSESTSLLLLLLLLFQHCRDFREEGEQKLSCIRINKRCRLKRFWWILRKRCYYIIHIAHKRGTNALKTRGRGVYTQTIIFLSQTTSGNLSWHSVNIIILSRSSRKNICPNICMYIFHFEHTFSRKDCVPMIL